MDRSEALVDIEDEELGTEWAAALYESYAADCEPTDTTRTPGVSFEYNTSLNAYANTAHRLCEEIERHVWENTCPYCHTVQEDIEDHQFTCEPMY